MISIFETLLMRALDFVIDEVARRVADFAVDWLSRRIGIANVG